MTTPSHLLKKLSTWHMPAEWEPHASTWLSWPHNPDTWPGKIEPVPAVWVKMIQALHTGEKVHLHVNHQQMKDEVVALLKNAGVNLEKIIFEEFGTNDCWMRDCGPLFIKNAEGRKRIVDWEFNKWGAKYPPWDLDNQVPAYVANKYGYERVVPGLVLEGGSIDVNGSGSLLTTESCLLNKNRNPKLTKKEIEEALCHYLGVKNILWLGDGIVGDDTDGHVDDITRFVNQRTIVTVVEEDPQDENFKPLQENLKRLKTMKDEEGRLFEIVTLPMPKAVVHEEQRLPASYANFYIANHVVLVPTYRDANDAIACATLQKFFPTRKIVGIDATDLVWGLGAFHCITQQEPI